MKSIENLTDVLVYILEGMYETEKQIQRQSPDMIRLASSHSLKSQIAITYENSFSNRLRLKRIFSYLLTRTVDYKEPIVAGMIKDFQPVPSLTLSPILGDIITSTALRGLACYRLAEYSSARDLAIQLDVETVINLLDQIVVQTNQEWHSLAEVALSDVNQNVPHTEA